MSSKMAANGHATKALGLIMGSQVDTEGDNQNPLL